MASSTLQQLVPFKISSSDIKGLEEEESRGSGSYGAVYAVSVRGIPRIAKRLHSILVGTDVNRYEKQGIRERFLNECLLLSKLDHPNVVKFVGVHFNPENHSDVTLIMEKLHMDLEKFLDLDQHPNIDTFIKLSILHDISSGLLYLHTQLAKPIIHRDLKAENVLLTEDFKKAKIADLGVSKLIDNHLHRAVTHTACPGTLAYMPPEALTDKAKYDTPLDVFSFGQLALYVALQQFPQVAFELSPEQWIRGYQLGEVAILKRKKWLDKLPEDHCLRDLILSCLRDNPSERPSTEKLNMKMKVLCQLKETVNSTLQELLPFEISSSDIKGLEEEESRGSGSYGAVYAVSVRGIPRIAKRLHSILVDAIVIQSERQGIRERFLNECLLLSKLDHPNVVRFIGIHFNPKNHSDVTLIMEQLHMDLEKFLNLDQRPNIDTFIKLSILRDVSSGLLYLHTQLAKPIIHRDLKAENVLLTEDYKKAKIADLGVSKLIDNHLHRAVTCTACPGTPAYMPPEALTDKAKYDTPLDVFSFGQLSLYVALQQFPIPYEMSPEEAIRAYQLGEVAIFKRKKWLVKLPEDHCLRDLILSCLRDNPSERPSTESLNVRMKVLCGLELEEFEIKNVLGIMDGEMYGSYTAVYKVIARGAPRIAKRLNNILDSELVTQDIHPSERQHIRERFHSECVALSKLDHPNILKFIGVHFNPEDRSDMAVIFERLHMSLEEVLNSQEFPDIHLNTKLSILHDVSCGLLYLHTQLETPFIHGELTAANVLLTDDLKQAKIADLGVLKLLDRYNYVNKQNKCWALAYLPPEVFSKNSKHDTCIDIFSFGHLALYIAIQQFPEISHEKELIVTGKKREVEVLKRKRWIDALGQDHCLQDLILQCLKDEPEKRPNAAKVNNIMSVLNSENNPERKTKYAIALPFLNQFFDLCHICRNGQLDLLKEFLYYNKDILHYQHPPTYTSALHQAVEGNQPNVIQLILLHGYNPNIRGRGGLTPLHLAVIKGQASCVRALIDNGADITVKDDQGQDAITKAELQSKKSEAVLKLLRSKEIVILAEKGDIHELETRLKQSAKPDKCNIEEAMLAAIHKSCNGDCIPILVQAGARHLDLALELAIQLENIQAIGILLLYKATINGDAATIRLLLSEPPESTNVPWYMPDVHKFFSQDYAKMSNLIAISISDKNYEATRELLLRTDLNMARSYVNWSELTLKILHPSWMYSIAPWVINFNLVRNHLRKLPSEIFSATQLRRLDLSQNLLETVSPDLFALPNLEYLSLSHNMLKEVPETDNWSASLLSLDLSVNKLGNLPQDIQCSSVENLNLSRNPLTVVPRCLYHIRTLTSLDLSYTLISSLPREMKHLHHLINLNVSNTNLPNGGGVLQGARIRGMFKAQVRSNKLCNHVKLMLLCTSDNVKNVMLSRLKPHFQLLPNQHLPEIDVFQWSFKPLLSRKKDKLFFNTWLIGSHNSCRFIYPCFFTPGALYVIVWDLTTAADLEKQIKAYVDLLVQYVPSTNVLVIVMLPEQFEGQFEGLNIKKQAKVQAARLNTFFSKPSYQSLSYQGVLVVVANPNVKEGQSDLKQRLYDAAQQMTVNDQRIIGRQIPDAYFSLISVLEKEQQALRTKSKPGILDESTLWMLFDKALDCDPPNKKELPDMVDFLKEAGFLLHYKEPNDRLDQYYFIRPTWLYNTLLRVVCFALEHRSHLFLTYSELCSLELANVSWSKDITQALVRLMIHYAIILPISRDMYLITCLLPHLQPPSEVLYCGTLRRQFAPEVYSIPTNLWSRLLCCIISNLSQITDLSKKQQDTDGESEHKEILRYLVFHYPKQASVDKRVEVWESGMIYNHKNIKFSIYPCVSKTEEKGIEICCTRDSYGYVIMARLCCLVQRSLEERLSHLFSAELPLEKHDLTQIAICPLCLEKIEKNPSCFEIEGCIRTFHLDHSEQLSCMYHTERISLHDLIPEYFLLDFPSHLCLTKTMFKYNEDKPLHRGRQRVIYSGHFNGKEVVITMYHQVDSQSIILGPLSCVRRETDMLSSLNHPNIIKIFGFCLNPLCVLLDKAPLGNLYQNLMDKEVNISRTVRFHIGCQVASALSYLHQRDIIYRTLKSSSILLWSLDFNCEASIKLANFEQAAYQSLSGLMSKTAFSCYSAPEMVRCSFREEYTEKMDIYAFGIFLYELVTRCESRREIDVDFATHSQLSKLPDAATSSYRTIVKLMEECRQEKAIARPSANDLLLKLSQPSFQCYIASQVLRDFVSVCGCCFVPSVQQIWVYGEYKKDGEEEISQGTQVFILSAENLTVQGSLELNERATTICTVDNKVWIGMVELCVHAYDTTTYQFTDRFRLNDSALIIADNDYYVFMGQANGQLKCFSKLQLQEGDCQPIIIEIGDDAITTMVTVDDIIWLGCGNELVILSAVDRVVIERREHVCESSDLVISLTVSHHSNTVWCLTSNSLCIMSWDVHTTERTGTTDLTEYLQCICTELNYDSNFMRIVCFECVGDTLWLGLSCGAIMILTDAEEPVMITHFESHRQAVDCLIKIPQSDELHQQHDYPLMLSGGFGEISSLSSTASEQNGVVMLWHAFTAHEFSMISQRHTNHHSTIALV